MRKFNWEYVFQSIVIGKYRFGLDYLSELVVQPLDYIGRVDDLPYGCRISIEGGEERRIKFGTLIASLDIPMFTRVEGRITFKM